MKCSAACLAYRTQSVFLSLWQLIIMINSISLQHIHSLSPLLKFRPVNYEHIVFPIFPQDKERAMPGHFNSQSPCWDPKGETEFTWTYLFRSPFWVPKKLMIFVFLEHSSGYITEGRSSQLSTILIFSLRDCCGDRFGSYQRALQGKQIKSFLYMSQKARHTSKPWHHFKIAPGCSWSHLRGMGALFIFVKSGPWRPKNGTWST